MLQGLRFGKRTGTLEVPPERRARRVAGGLRPCPAGDLDGFGPDIREPPTDGAPIVSMHRSKWRAALPSSASRLMAGASAFFMLSQSGRRFRLIVDGTVIQRSIVDFGDRPLPAAIRNGHCVRH